MKKVHNNHDLFSLLLSCQHFCINLRLQFQESANKNTTTANKCKVQVNLMDELLIDVLTVVEGEQVGDKMET